MGPSFSVLRARAPPPEKRAFFQIEKPQFGLVSRPKTSMISAVAVEKPSVAWPAAKVEIWPIERLTANPRNARIHGPEQIEQIRASLREFGWTMPVLVRENGILIAGHGRLEAAKLEGIEEVPTIVARGWSEAAGKMSRGAVDLHSRCDPSRFAVSPW